MRKVCSACVSHMIMTEQVRHHIELCEKWRRHIETDPTILSRIITTDETWIHYFDPLSKQWSNTWKSSTYQRKKKVGQQKSAGKVMLIAFFDRKGVVYQHTVPPKANSECRLLPGCHRKALRTRCANTARDE